MTDMTGIFVFGGIFITCAIGIGVISLLEYASSNKSDDKLGDK